MNIPNYDGAGVYKISFGESFYIGSSLNVKSRILSHSSLANRGKEPKKLQEKFDAGIEAHVDILQKIGDNRYVYNLRLSERRFIEALQPDLNEMRTSVFPMNFHPDNERAAIARNEEEIRRLTQEILDTIRPNNVDVQKLQRLKKRRRE